MEKKYWGDKIKDLMEQSQPKELSSDFYIGPFLISGNSKPRFSMGWKDAEILYQNAGKNSDALGRVMFSQAISIDGGSSVIYKSSSSLLGLIKLCIITFDFKTQKSKIDISYYISSTRAARKNGNYHFQTTAELIKGEGIDDMQRVYFENEASDSSGMLKQIEENLDIARTVIEKGTVKHYSDKYSDINIDSAKSEGQNTDEKILVIYDGSLFKRYTQEDALYGKARILGNNCTIGFCKTSNLLSEYSSPNRLLEKKFQGFETWLFSLSENISFAKLHRNARFSFRIDSKIKPDAQIFNALLVLCRDPAFYGYPYPLISADKFARVSNREVGRIKLIAGSYSKDSSIIAKDAHNILDTMEF